MFVLMLNVALGSEPEIVFEWLVAKNVLIGSNSDKRTVHLVSFISNVYKQRFLQLVGVSENLSNGLVFSRKF